MCQRSVSPLVARSPAGRVRMRDAPRPWPGGVAFSEADRARARLTQHAATALGYFAAGLEKSTVGAVRAPGFVTSKYSRGFAPVTFAVSDCGNVLM